MKTLILSLTLATAAFTISSCANSSTAVNPYTSDYCIVTDSKLGSMGDPVTIIHNGQEVKFCCAPCVKKFNKNPGKYLAKLK